VVELIDLSRLELLSGESMSDTMMGRRADLLFRAPLWAPGEDGRQRQLYMRVELHLLAEHQSRPHVLMPLRAAEYTLGFWQSLLRADPTRKSLPPVITLVVHHGPGGWTAPRSLHEMVDGLSQLPALLPYVPNMQLVIDDLAFTTDAELQARPLLPVPKVAVWLLRDGRDVDALLAHIPVWAEVLSHVLAEAPDVALVFLRYISRIATERSFQDVRRAILEHVATAEAPLASIAEELRQEGRQEAAEALRRVVRTLLEQRGGPISEQLAARISAASLQELEAAVSRVLTVTDPNSLFSSH
jgi:predicted transposase YdaD